MHGHDVDTKDLHAVRRVVTEIYRELFPSGQTDFVDNAFKWATDAFSGNYGDFQKIDAKYHDFDLQELLAANPESIAAGLRQVSPKERLNWV